MSSNEDLKGKTKKGLYWNAFNMIVGNGLSFVVGIIMARVLSPSDFGITALPTIFLAVAQVFIECGFNNALVRKPNLDEKDLSTAFYYSIIVGVVCYITLFFCAPLIADFYNVPILTPLIRVTAITFILNPLITPQNVILNRQLNFKTPAYITILTKIIGATVGIYLAYHGYGIWSLVIMTLVSNALTCLFTWIYVRWLPKTRWSKESFRYLWNFGNKLVAVNLMDTLFNNISQLVIGKFYTPADLGYYNRAEGYANLPATNISSVIRNVSFPVLSKLQDDINLLARTYRRMIKAGAFVVFPVMALLACVAEPLIVWMLTDKWIDCVPYLQILSIKYMWFPLQLLNLNLLTVTGRTDLFLRLEIIKKVLLAVVIIATLPIGVMAFAIGQLIYAIIVLMINSYYTGKMIDYGFFKQIKDISHILLLTAVAGGIAFFSMHFVANMVLQLITATVVFGGIYLVGSYLFKFEEIAEIRELLKTKK